MGGFVAKKILKKLITNGLKLQFCKVLILGITFKENCPDIRNTKVVDIYHELKDFGLEVDVYDPWATPNDVKQEYGVTLTSTLNVDGYDGIIVAVAHEQFLELNLNDLKKDNQSVIFDLKSIFNRELVDMRL